MWNKAMSTAGRIRGDLWLLAPWLFVLAWAGGYSFAKLGLRHMEPLTLLMTRYAIAMALMAPLLLQRNVRLPADRSHWITLAISGFLIQGVYFGLAYLAMKQGIDAGTIALILSMQPILVAVFAPVVLGEPVNRIFWFGLGLGFAGAFLVILAKSGFAPSSLPAILLALGALVGISAATVYEKKFGRETHPVTSGVIQYVVGFATIAPLALTLETQEVSWHRDLFVSLAYLVLVNSILAISLLIGLIRRGTASKVSALFYLVPPLAILVAWLVLGETMPTLAWAGFAISMAGMVAVGRAR